MRVWLVERRFGRDGVGDETGANPGPAAAVLPRARAGVKRLRIGVSTIAASPETIRIAAPPLCASDDPDWSDGAMIGAVE
jgi:hypothetical protein